MDHQAKLEKRSRANEQRLTAELQAAREAATAAEEQRFSSISLWEDKLKVHSRKTFTHVAQAATLQPNVRAKAAPQDYS